MSESFLPTQPFLFQFNIAVCFVVQLRRVLSYNVKYATRRQGIVHLCVVTSVPPLPPPSLFLSSPLELSGISLPTNVCVSTYMCTIASLWTMLQLAHVSLLPRCGFQDQTQVFRLGGECPYPLSHLVSLKLHFKKINQTLV